MNQENTKRCPQCAEVIKAEAVKCRYCGSDCRSDKMTAEKPQPAAIKRKSPWKLGCLIVVGVFALLLILFMLGGGEPTIDCSSQDAFRESSGEVIEYIEEEAKELLEDAQQKEFKGIDTSADKKRFEDLKRAINNLIILVGYGQGEQVQVLDGMTPEEVVQYFKKQEEEKCKGGLL